MSAATQLKLIASPTIATVNPRDQTKVSPRSSSSYCGWDSDGVVRRAICISAATTNANPTSMRPTTFPSPSLTSHSSSSTTTTIVVNNNNDRRQQLWPSSLPSRNPVCKSFTAMVVEAWTRSPTPSHGSSSFSSHHRWWVSIPQLHQDPAPPLKRSRPTKSSLTWGITDKIPYTQLSLTPAPSRKVH